MNAPIDAAAFRARFPSLADHVHLAGCSLGARSTDLDDALARMLADMAGGGAPWEVFEARIAGARDRFAALVGADPAQVAVLPSASIGAYQVASTRDWGRRPRIVTSGSEFPSVAHVWLAQRPRGAEVVHAGPWERWAELIDDRTRLVSAPMTGYQYAERLPVAELAGLAHAAGAEMFVDAYQAVGVEPVDVTALGCDYLVAGTSKYLLGLPGLAFLYTRDPDAADIAPTLTGWFGRVDPFAFDPTRLDWAAGAARYQTGTAAVPAAYAAEAGLDLVGALDLTAVREHIGDLTDLAVTALTAQGEEVTTPPRELRGAHVGLLDPDPAGLTSALAARGIAVSPRGPVVRLAFHLHNNAADVTALCAALTDIRADDPGARTRVHS